MLTEERLTWRWSGVPGQDLHDALRAACAAIEPRSYLEIGVDGGESLRTVLISSRPQRIVLCDIWDPSYCNHGFRDHRHVDAVLAQFGAEAFFLDGSSREFIPALSDEFDLITIDGDHSHDGAAADLANCWPLLARGGLMVIDDVCHPNYPGVPIAVAEFLQRYSGAEPILAESHCNAMMVRKR